ncbi:hypothetical protein ACSFA3_09605 [Variovorax sp. RHLX14]|uniref:hypothetical protein n=1 Tax=Variovorax sp. RHLX14 TaxID=1259731 RepID=UPI003F48BE69
MDSLHKILEMPIENPPSPSGTRGIHASTRLPGNISPTANASVQNASFARANVVYQATTSDGAAFDRQRLLMRARQLSAAIAIPGVDGLLQTQQALGDIAEDATLPEKTRDGAAYEIATLIDETASDSVVRFLREMQTLAGSAGVPVGTELPAPSMPATGAQRNYPSPQAQAPVQVQPTQAQVGGMPAFVRPVDNYFNTPARLRAAIVPHPWPCIQEAEDQIVVQGMGRQQCIDNLIASRNISKATAADHYRTATNRISFGLTRKQADEMLDYVKNYVTTGKTPRAMETSIGRRFLDVPHNPAAVVSLIIAAQAYVNPDPNVNPNGAGKVADISWETLRPHMPPEHLNHFAAMETKGRVAPYATRGHVSPPPIEVVPSVGNPPAVIDVTAPAIATVAPVVSPLMSTVMSTVAANTASAVPMQQRTAEEWSRFFQKAINSEVDTVEPSAKRQRQGEASGNFPAMPLEPVHTLLPSMPAVQQTQAAPIAMETLHMPAAPLPEIPPPVQAVEQAVHVAVPPTAVVAQNLPAQNLPS